MEIKSDEWKRYVKKCVADFNLEMDGTALDLLADHASELVRWNKKKNLTAITDPVDVAVKHVVDSLAPLEYIPEDSRVLDIGSGGGFPGIPLKIARPSADVVMIDASRRKVTFLNHVIRLLKLENIKAVHVRGEDMPDDPTYKNGFDVVICRAFSSLENFVAMALPLLKKDGSIIAMKGRDEEDLALAAQQGSNALDVTIKRYELPDPDLKSGKGAKTRRSIVRIKRAAT